MTQAADTPEAWAAMVKKPENREQTLRGLAERFGCRLVSFHFCYGKYDAVLTVEAPDEVTAASAVVAAASAGHLRSVKTTLLLTAEQGMEVMRKAGSVPFLRPGQ